MPILQGLANGSARGYGMFVPSGAAGAFESIASATGTGSSGTVTFSSIPSTYQSLQLRIACINTTGDNMVLRVNGVTTASYTWHRLRGTGAAASADSGTSATGIFFIDNGGATYPSSLIIDIHNYTSTTQNKTVRAFSGLDENGGGSVVLSSGLFINTAAVTSLTFKTETTGNFTTASQFALYGIKGA
jgi:hypothetical protein